jgi:hypothetical protein
MKGKKERIEHIASINSFDSIFNSKEILKSFIDKVYTKPYPSFCYKDEEEKGKLSFFDKVNYYQVNSEFKLLDYNTIAILIEVDLKAKTAVLVAKDMPAKKFGLDEITRVF